MNLFTVTYFKTQQMLQSSAHFKYQPAHQLSWLKFLLGFLVPYQQILGLYLVWTHKCLLLIWPTAPAFVWRTERSTRNLMQYNQLNIWNSHHPSTSQKHYHFS
jgi:uncharacterized Tic20 family protein